MPPLVMIENAQCFLCGAKEGAALRRDKHQRAYMKCVGCGSTLFAPTPTAERTLAWLLKTGQRYYAAAAAPPAPVEAKVS